jgi:transposase
MAARVQLREITSEEGSRLLRMVRRTSGSVVTWRRAQVVLLSAQGVSPPMISEVVFTVPDTVRDVIHNFNADGFDSLYPRYRGGRSQTLRCPSARRSSGSHWPTHRTSISRSRHGAFPSSRTVWSLRVVTDISHEGLCQLLREENVRFQAVRTWKRSTDPNFAAERDRIVELYEMAEAGEAVGICLDEFGPLNLQPQPGGKGWAPRAKPKRITCDLQATAWRQAPDRCLRRQR